MSNEPKADLAGVDELVGRLRQPNECERWLFSVPFEAADMLQSLIATAREAEALRARLHRLYTIILENSPDTTIADNGMTVWDGLHNEARAALEQGEVK